MNKTLNRLATLFLLCLSILSLIALLVDSFSLTTDKALYLWLLAGCVLLWIAGSFRKGLWIGMALSAALLFAAYQFYHANPLTQLMDLLDHIAGAFYTQVKQLGSSYSYTEPASSHSLVLLFLGFLLASYGITALTARNGRISLALLGFLPVFAACIIVNGNPPILPSAGIVLYWFLLIATGSSYRTDGKTGRTFLCVLLPLCIALGCLLLLRKPENYTYTERDAMLNKRFERLTQWVDRLFGIGESETVYLTDPDQSGEASGPRSSFQSSWDADDNSMQLTKDYDFSNANLRLLQVKAETTGQIYLRIQSFGEYSGTGWTPAADLNAGSSLPFTAFAAADSPFGVKREMEIRTFVDLPALCIPYFAAVSSGSDVLVEQDGQINYLVSYTAYPGDPSQLRLSGDALSAEQVYRDYAHAYYTMLPSSTRMAAASVCRDAGLDSGIPDLIQAVATYVQESGEYDLTVKASSSDDIAIYFLTQSHRGYCIHYASAAAVLYRYLGIPARVTEGFLVETEAGRYTDVLGGNAHAWVEVYVDGLGWIPVEVTAQAGVLPSEPSPEAPASPSPEYSPAPEDDRPGGSDQQENGTPEQQPAPTAASSESDAQKEAKHSFLRVLLRILVLLLLLPLWYGIQRLIFLSATRNGDDRKAAVACWRYGVIAEKYGAELPPSLVHTAEKAAFSPHAIRREEAEQCRRELAAEIRQIDSALPPLKKFVFRYLRGLK